MSQSDIIELLEKTNKPISRGEIAKLLNFDPIIVSHSIRRLIKSDDIKYKEIKSSRTARKLYGSCRGRMRLYYIEIKNK